MQRQRAIVLLLLLGWVASGYSVESYSEVYSCGSSLHDQVVVHVPLYFNFSKSCEESWTKLPENISVASVTFNSKPQCHKPCVQVSLGELILSECSKVQLIVTCDDGIKIWEKRIEFCGKLARRSSHHHIGIYCSLLMVVLAVIIFGCVIRSRYKEENTKIPI